MTEEQEILKRKLYWRCRRGMLEVDELLLAFMDRGYDALNQHEHESFVRLLEDNDNELLEYLMGRTVPKDGDTAHVVNKIRAATQA